MLRSCSSCNIQLRIASAVLRSWRNLHSLDPTEDDTPSAIPQISVVWVEVLLTHIVTSGSDLCCVGWIWRSDHQWTRYDHYSSITLNLCLKEHNKQILKGYLSCVMVITCKTSHTEHTEIINNKSICCRCHPLHALINSCSIYCGLISESLHILIKLKITTTTQLTFCLKNKTVW